MFKTIGERICYCRNLIGLTQREFALKFKISKPTITRWELNVVSIPLKKIARLVNFFAANYLKVQIEWLESGIGALPIFDSNRDFGNLNFDELSYSTLHNLKTQILGLEIFQVSNDFMAPICKSHDYIGCVFTHEIERLDGKLCCAITSYSINIGVFVYNTLSLHNYNNHTIKLVGDEFKLGEVICLIKDT